MAKRVLVYLNDETATRLYEMAEKFNMSKAQLGALCVTMGLDALKLALNPASVPILEEVQKNVDKVVLETQAGDTASRKGSRKKAG